MEKVILDVTNHIKNITKRKLYLDIILQRTNKISATNLDNEAWSELEKQQKDFYETSSVIDAQDTPVAKAKLDIDSHNNTDSPTTNANPDISFTFLGTQDTSVIKSSISCDKKKNLTPLISCTQKEDDDIWANMMALKSFLMNEIFDLRLEIVSLQLQLQQEKLSKSKNSCGNEENIVIEDLKFQITS